MMMAFHIYNIAVIERTHAAASIFRPNQREKQIICEDLCRPISRLSLWWIPGEGIKTGGKPTHPMKIQITFPYSYLGVVLPPLILGGKGNRSPSVASMVEEAEETRFPS
jgi:hypothetical protein